jgi:hypothetical protein
MAAGFLAILKSRAQWFEQMGIPVSIADAHHSLPRGKYIVGCHVSTGTAFLDAASKHQASHPLSICHAGATTVGPKVPVATTITEITGPLDDERVQPSPMDLELPVSICISIMDIPSLFAMVSRRAP